MFLFWTEGDWYRKPVGSIDRQMDARILDSECCSWRVVWMNRQTLKKPIIYPFEQIFQKWKFCSAVLVRPIYLTFFFYCFKRSYFTYINFLPIYIYACVCLVPKDNREGIRSPGTTVTDGLKYQVSAGNQALVLCKNNKCS